MIGGSLFLYGYEIAFERIFEEFYGGKGFQHILDTFVLNIEIAVKANIFQFPILIDNTYSVASLNFFDDFRKRFLYKNQAVFRPGHIIFYDDFVYRDRSFSAVEESSLPGNDGYRCFSRIFSAYLYGTFLQGCLYTAVIFICPYIKAGTQYFHHHFAGVYQERFFLVPGHGKISFAFQVNLPLFSSFETYGKAKYGFRVQEYFRTVGE